MNQFLSFLLVLLFCSPNFVAAQNHYNIRLLPVGETQGGKINYQVQLAAADGIPLNLAGQNYRLYYDASILKLDKQASNLLLDNSLYTPLLWKQEIEKIDASGVGSLAYADNLGFINFSVDLEDNKTGGIQLPASGEWLSIANLSFNLINQESTPFNEEHIALSWARPSLTAAYATAYVEVGEWKNITKVIPALAATYYDQSFTTSVTEEWVKAIAIFPNPFNHQLTVQYDSEEKIELEVWTIHGKKLIKQTLPKGNHSILKDFSNFSSGTYQVRMTKGHQMHIKLIKKIQ